jgi:Peptidase family M48
MPIKYQDETFPGLQEFIETRERNRLSDENATPLYAHPVDEWIIKTLNATPVKMLMNKAMDVVVSVSFGYELANAVYIDQKSFPDLFEVLSHSAKTLGIPIPHAVVSNAPGLFNAYAAGTDDYAFISIAAALTHVYTKEEAWFVIGHECGHIHATHMVYHTLGKILHENYLPINLGYLAIVIKYTAGLALDAWSRRSEVTSDRAGLLCCGDVEVAERALLKLITGFADINRVDIDDYLRRSRSVQDFHPASEFTTLFQSHPMIPRRIEALRLFADSELYYELSGKTPPPGKKLLDRAELDRRTNQIVAP